MEEPTKKEDKPQQLFSWSAPKAILVTVAIYLLSQVIAGVALSVYPHLVGWSHTQTNQWLNSSISAQFFFVLLVEAITLGLLYLFLRKHKVNFRLLELKWPRLSDVGYALAGFAVYLPLYVASLSIIQAVVPKLNVDQKQQLGFEHANGPGLVLVFISLVVLPPLVEEILVRGFLYGSLKAHWPKIHAMIVTSVLFAVAHLQIGSGASLLWVAAIDTFILSLVLIYLKDKTNSLAASIMLHMLKNGIAFLSLFIFHLS